MGRLPTFIIGAVLMIGAIPASASARIQPFGSHAAKRAPLVQTCKLDRQRLTLCDIRSASAKLAQHDSYDGTYHIRHCQTTSQSCYASDALDPRKLPDFGIAITGDTGPMIWTGLTRVTQHRGRICARWALIYGSACV